MCAAGAVNTLARHGLEVEVGPTPQGVLRDHTTQLMEKAVGLCLDYLSSVSEGNPLPVPRELGVYLDCGKVAHHRAIVPYMLFRFEPLDV